MKENLVNVSIIENPKIALTIAAYTNKINVDFIKPIDVALTIHNNDEDAHSNILINKADVSTTYTKNEINTKLSAKADIFFAATVASSLAIVFGG